MNILKRSGVAVLSGVMLACASLLPSCSKEDDLLTYRYNYDLSEYIDLPEYKNLPAQCSDYRLTEDEMNTEVERQILLTRYSYSREIDVTDRGAAEGDIVTVDYTAYENGELTASDSTYEITLGFGMVPDEFESALSGVKPGDEKSFDCVYPENYQDEDLAGKTVSVNLTVVSVCAAELPDYDDEFVRAYLGFDSVADFENALRQSIEDNAKDSYYMVVDGQTWTALFNNTNVKKYPDREYQERYDAMVGSAEAYAKTAGANFPDYVEAVYGMTEDEFYSYADEQAKILVKDDMIKYSIARAENVTISDEEYEIGVRELAARYDFDTAADFENTYDKAEIREILLFEKVHELVADLADVTYTEE